MRFAVLGCNSFSGSNMVNKLLNIPGAEVLGVGRSDKSDLFLPYTQNKNLSNFTINFSDIRETELLMNVLDKYCPEYIINFVAISEVFPSIDFPAKYFETNTLANMRLCEKLKSRKYLTRYIHISTCEVYGDCQVPKTENEALRPTTPYAISKATLDMYLMSQFKHRKFPMNIIRSTSVYGVGQQLYKIIPRTIIKMMQNEPIKVHGAGEMVRTFIHISDVCDGIIGVINAGRVGEVYNFSSCNSLSVLNVIKQVALIMGDKYNCSIEMVPNERPGQDYAYLLNYNKAGSELSWEPKISFARGVSEVIDWIQGNFDNLLEEELNYVSKE